MGGCRCVGLKTIWEKSELIESLVCRGHNCLSCFISSVLGVSIGRPFSYTYFLDKHVLL